MEDVQISCAVGWMIDRDLHLGAVRSLLARSPVVALLGARQVGKTTLARTMQRAMEELGLGRLDLIHAGADSYDLNHGVRAISVARLTEETQPLWPRP